MSRSQFSRTHTLKGNIKSFSVCITWFERIRKNESLHPQMFYSMEFWLALAVVYLNKDFQGNTSPGSITVRIKWDYVFCFLIQRLRV